MDVTFHYPPELLGLLVDTIPLLCRSKKDTLLFLKGAGVSKSLMADLARTVEISRDEISKFEIVRTVLTRLNSHGDRALRERREIVRRVVEFDDFSACWESDRLKAQGLVVQVQKLVHVKDSFTRMKDERERERKANIEKRESEVRAIQEHRDKIDGLKLELFALFNQSNPHVRGKKLEDLLNRIFAAFGISVRQAFVVRDDETEGTIEQIDGVIELNCQLYFVEMKWWKEPVGVPEISQHMMRVFLRAETGAIIISASGYTSTAISECRRALSQKVVTLCTLEEIVMVLERKADLGSFLRQKVQSTIMTTAPFPQIAID